MQMDEGHYDTPWEFKNRAIAAALRTANKAAAHHHGGSPLALLKCGATRNGTVSGGAASQLRRSHNVPIGGTVTTGGSPNVRQRVSASNFFSGPDAATAMATSTAIPSTSSAGGTSSPPSAERPRRRFSTNSSAFDIQQQQKQNLVEQQQHLPSISRSDYRHPSSTDDDLERSRVNVNRRQATKQPPSYSDAMASSSTSNVILFECHQPQRRRASANRQPVIVCHNSDENAKGTPMEPQRNLRQHSDGFSAIVSSGTPAQPSGTPLSTPSSSASTSSSLSSANSSAARRRSAAIAERRHEHYPLVGTATDWHKTTPSESPLSLGGTASSASSMREMTRHSFGECEHHLQQQQQLSKNPNGRQMIGKNNNNNNKTCQCSLTAADNRTVAESNSGSGTVRSYGNGTCHKDTKSMNNPNYLYGSEPSRINRRLVHIGLERAAAERVLLEAGQVGDFLLRQRSATDDANLALSLRAGDGVLHIKLERRDHLPPEFRDGDENACDAGRPTWVLGEGPRFATISSMLKCYRRMELPVRGAEHVCLRTAFTVDDLATMSR